MSATCPPTGCGDCCATLWLGYDMSVLQMRAARWFGEGVPDVRVDSDAWVAWLTQHWPDEELVSRDLGSLMAGVADLMDNAARIPEVWAEVENRDDGWTRFECSVFDTEARTCLDWENRPPVCRSYPWYDGKVLGRTELTSGRCTFVADDPTTVFLTLVTVNGVDVA